MTRSFHVQRNSRPWALALLCLLSAAIAGCGWMATPTPRPEPWGGADTDLIRLPVVARGYAAVPSERKSRAIVMDGKSPPAPLPRVAEPGTVVLLADRKVSWTELERTAMAEAARGTEIVLGVMTEVDPPRRGEIPIKVKLATPREGIPSDEVPPMRLQFVAGPDGSLQRVMLNHRDIGSGPRALEELSRFLAELQTDPRFPIEIHIHGQETRWGDIAPVLSAAYGSRISDGTTKKFNVVLSLGVLDLEEEIVELDVMPLEALTTGPDPVDSVLEPTDLVPVDDPFGPGIPAEPAIPQPLPRLRVERGASAQAEKAVGAALKWLAEHQTPEGSWSYDHRPGRCAGRCANHGTLADAKIAATSQALLAFLAAGQTHQDGQYKRVVTAGLGFLLRKIKVEGERGDLMEPGGTMYSQGIATLVLCSAYDSTNDKGLLKPAQLALNQIVHSQDPVGGGWRYAVKQPGDTSVTGWQLSALKAGQLADLNVPPATLKLTSKFLDGVQSADGSQYGYTAPATGHNATSAIGLLGRIYEGWTRERLAAGVKHLADRGPSPENMYYNYYATQVMHHSGGDEWKKWNDGMRKQLVEKQEKTGHAEGSWHFAGGDVGSEGGGRLYCTALATLTLEVYYRHLPLFGKEAGIK